MADVKLTAIIDAKDNASTTFKSVGDKLEGIGDKAKQLGKNLSLYVTTPLVALGGFAVKSAAELDSLRGAYDRLTQQVGINGDEMLSKLRELSGGAVSDMDLIQSANKAMALGLGDSMDTMTTLMEVARLKSRAMGITTTQAFNDIVTGIGRGSPLILDNLGIIVKLGEANDAYAKELGKTTEELSASEKQQALLNAVMVSAKEELAQVGELQQTDAERMQQFTAELTNFKTELGHELLPVVMEFLKQATVWIKKFSELTDGQKKTIVIVGALAAALGPLLLAINAIITAMTALGAVMAFLTGPIGAVMVAVGALAFIGWKMAKDWDMIKGDLKIVWQAIRDFVVGMIDQMVGKIQGLIDKVMAIPNKVSSVISSAGSKISSFSNNVASKVSGWLSFGTGGVVPGPIGAPVPAIVHGGETVLPAGSKAAGGIVININNPSVRNDGDIQKLARAVQDVISRNQELRGLGVS